MKVSYSKVLVHGVIATTLLMAMSCQKKGTARGIQPQTATKTSTPETEPNVNEPKLNNVPGVQDPIEVKPQVKPPVVANPSSTDTTPAKTDTTSETDTTPEPTTETDTSPKVTTGKKTEPTNVTPKVCPESIVKATNAMTQLYKKISDEEKLSTTTDTVKIKDYTAYHQLCVAWPKLFTTEKIESCGDYAYIAGLPVNLARNAKSADTSCIKFATSLKELTGQDNEVVLAAAKAQAVKMKSLRAEKFVVSDEGKEMFSKENAKWNMYIVNGELQTDTNKLTDALSAKKVACTITKSATDKFTHAQNVNVSITTASALEVLDHADKLQNGVLFGLRIKAIDKDATAEEAAKVPDQISEMYCMNLDNKDIKVSDLKKALGQHIAVKQATEAKVESKK